MLKLLIVVNLLLRVFSKAILCFQRQVNDFTNILRPSVRVSFIFANTIVPLPTKPTIKKF